MIQYIKESDIVGKRQTSTPNNYSLTGYGRKLPTSWQLQLKSQDGRLRWYRVYVICFSNSGSAYIVFNNSKLFLGSYDPSF